MKGKGRILAIGLCLTIVIVFAIWVGSRSGTPDPDPVIELPQLTGLALQDVIDEFGSPTQTYTYPIGEAPTKNWNHGILFNTYPKGDPDNLKVQIREMHWQDGDYNIYVCFHLVEGKWVVLGARRIRKGVKF
jgi:hypothetical protein